MQCKPTLVYCVVRMAPPAATVAAKAAQRDPRAAVSFADRVPYVVVHGPPSAPLVRSIRRVVVIRRSPTPEFADLTAYMHPLDALHNSSNVRLSWCCWLQNASTPDELGMGRALHTQLAGRWLTACPSCTWLCTLRRTAQYCAHL